MHEHARSDRIADPTASLTDPAALATREDVRSTDETANHDDRDHCGAGTDGRAVVGVTDGDELLVLVEDDLGVAVLPHGTVDPGGDWAVAARDCVEAQTGIAVDLDAVEAVRDVDHVVDGTHHTSTIRVVYSGSPAGGEIRACKRDADAGSDGWRAAWIDSLPDGVVAPEGGPRDDLRTFL